MGRVRVAGGIACLNLGAPLLILLQGLGLGLAYLLIQNVNKFCPTLQAL